MFVPPFRFAGVPRRVGKDFKPSVPRRGGLYADYARGGRIFRKTAVDSTSVAPLAVRLLQAGFDGAVLPDTLLVIARKE